MLPEPQFAETSLVGDGSGIPLRPDLAAALPQKTEIPADLPPEDGNKLNPLYVALPVAGIAFVAAYFLIGGRGKKEGAAPASEGNLTDPSGIGEDFRG